MNLESYLRKQNTGPLSEGIEVSRNTELIIVIPVYNEPSLLVTMESLVGCDVVETFTTEVILLINSYLNTPHEIKDINRKTYSEALEFAERYNSSCLKFIPLLVENIPAKKTGAGIPRKLGMDEAVRRFAGIHQENGIIVSLDADCMVDKNYITTIHKCFSEDQKLCSATISFHHPVEHLSSEDPLRKSAELYEAYLHYYKSALEYCGYPYAYYTIGSAMAFRVSVYTRSGGMGKQEAGEDFYFLQKIFPMGKTKEITTTRVYPAARTSDRVPFGTGPALAKMSVEKEIKKETYSFESFQMLKTLFSDIDHFYQSSYEKTEVYINNLPEALKRFLEDDHFSASIEEINKNTSTLSSFRKRFFNYFNAFKIVKFLNCTHPHFIPFKDVLSEQGELNGELKIELINRRSQS